MLQTIASLLVPAPPPQTPRFSAEVPAVFFQPTHACVNCDRLVELDRHGRCGHCQSDAVYSA